MDAGTRSGKCDGLLESTILEWSVPCTFYKKIRMCFNTGTMVYENAIAI